MSVTELIVLRAVSRDEVNGSLYPPQDMVLHIQSVLRRELEAEAKEQGVEPIWETLDYQSRSEAIGEGADVLIIKASVRGVQ